MRKLQLLSRVNFFTTLSNINCMVLKLGVIGGIGLLSSRLTVEGPIQKDKTSF